MIVFAAATAVAVVGLGAPPASATKLSNDFNIINCKNYKFAPGHKIQACTTPIWANQEHTALDASADVTAYKKVKLNGVKQWVPDDSTQVSADSAQLFVDGQPTLGIGLPSGPLNGYASSGTRGQFGLETGTTYNIFSKGTLGLWQNGVETHTINVQSFTASVTG